MFPSKVTQCQKDLTMYQLINKNNNMKCLSLKDIIEKGVNAGETVASSVKKYGRKQIFEILKYYDLEEAVLKEYHFHKKEEDQPKEEVKVQQQVQSNPNLTKPVNNQEPTKVQNGVNKKSENSQVITTPSYIVAEAAHSYSISLENWYSLGQLTGGINGTCDVEKEVSPKVGPTQYYSPCYLRQ